MCGTGLLNQKLQRRRRCRKGCNIWGGNVYPVVLVCLHRLCSDIPPKYFCQNIRGPVSCYASQRLTAILQVACCPDFAATSMRRVFRAPGAYPLSPLEDPLTPDSRHLKRRVPVLSLSLPRCNGHMLMDRSSRPISPGLTPTVCLFQLPTMRIAVDGNHSRPFNTLNDD